MLVSRRAFLVGAAATIAATQLPPAEILAKPVTVPAANFPRWVTEVMLSAEISDYSQPQFFINSKISRGLPTPEGALLNFAFSSYGVLRWNAVPDTEILVTPEYPLYVECEPCWTNVRMNLFSCARDYDKTKYRRGQGFVEQYVWRGKDLISADVTPTELEPPLLNPPDTRSWWERWFGKRETIDESYDVEDAYD